MHYITRGWLRCDDGQPWSQWNQIKGSVEIYWAGWDNSGLIASINLITEWHWVFVYIERKSSSVRCTHHAKPQHSHVLSGAGQVSMLSEQDPKWPWRYGRVLTSFKWNVESDKKSNMKKRVGRLRIVNTSVVIWLVLNRSVFLWVLVNESSVLLSLVSK